MNTEYSTFTPSKREKHKFQKTKNTGLNENFLNPGNQFLEPDMKPPENEILYKYMDKASTFFEFGSGGSTHQAMKRGLTTYTVESSPAFHNLIKHDFQIIDIQKYYSKHIKNRAPNITYITYDLQLNSESTRNDWITYTRTYNHSKYQSDLIYIHGNCRDATALNVFNEIDDKTIVLFEAPLPIVLAYENEVNELLNYYELIEQSDTLYVLKKSELSKKVPKKVLHQRESKSQFYYDNLHGTVKRIMNTLVNSYPDIVRSYAYNVSSEAVKPKENYVWTMWSSGEKNAPFISTQCFRSMKKNLRNEKLIILDLNDSSYYSGMPAHIFKKLDNKNITLTHFTDILRCYLIAEYGGMWIDSTIYLSGELDPNWFNYPFYTNKFMSTFFVGKGRWTGFCQSGFQNSLLHRFARDMLFAYWADHDRLPHYFILDFIFCVGYRYIPTIRRLIDSVPESTKNIYALPYNFNEPYTSELMNKILSNGPIFKLSNKEQYYRTAGSKQTIFDHIFHDQFRKGKTYELMPKNTYK